MDETKRSLVRKLSEVMAAVSHVPKTGHNNFHHYDYATEADITASVRQELAKRSVMLIPSVESCEFLEVLTNANKKERLCTMRMTFTAHDGESGETIPFNAVGQGQDASDKAAYKAATGATKYALLKLFLIPTGDDPEQDSKPVPQPKPSKAASPSKPAAPTAAQVAKLVEAFSGLGVPVGQLEDRIGCPLGVMTMEQFESLKEYGKKKKEMAADPDAAARDEVMRRAEAEMAAAVAGGKDPRFVAFEGLIDRIRAATSPAQVTLIHAEAAKVKLFTDGDLKALQRSAADRTLILEDKAKESKRQKLRIQEEGSDLTQ